MANYPYSRRNEVARSKGFASYPEYRKIVEYANNDKDNQFKGTLRSNTNSGIAGGRKGENLDAAKVYYQAFKVEPASDYSVTSAKAKWIIEYAKYVKDADEWKQRYPSGVRG